jgi:hypothetical protein
MFAFFSSEIKSVVKSTQNQQISDAFRPMLSELIGNPDEELISFASDFHEKNVSFEFSLIGSDDEILFQTENFEFPEEVPEISIGATETE